MDDIRERWHRFRAQMIANYIRSKQMKPFNLERALAGDPVVTRDNRTVKDIHYFKDAINSRQLVGVVDGKLHAFETNGKCFGSNSLYSNDDVFMATKTRTVKMKLYKNNIFGVVAYEAGLSLCDSDFIQEIEIEVEE